MKKFSITYYLGGQNFHRTTFKGTRSQAKDYAQAYRIKKHLAPYSTYLQEITT